MGFIDSLGNTIIDCKFDYVGEFHDGLAITVMDSMYGYIDMKGKYQIEPEHNLIHHISTGTDDIDLKPLDTKRVQQFLSHLKTHPDTVFNYDIPKIFDFNEGLAVYYDKGKYGFINSSGKKVIPAIYTYANEFSEGLAAVKVKLDDEIFGESLYGYINGKGDNIIKPQYTLANNFSEGKSTVGIVYNYIDKTTSHKLHNVKLFVINSKGDILFSPEVQAVAKFVNGYAGCYSILYESLTGSGTNYLDSTGSYYVPYEKLSFVKVRAVSNPESLTDSVSYLDGKLFLVQDQSGKWGFLPEKLSEHDKPSNQTFIYDEAQPFSENLAAVKIDGNWGYIDAFQNITIKPVYTKAERFKHGLAYTEQDKNGFKLRGYVNKQGVMVWSDKNY